jgi:hypothetical protein
LNDQKVVDAARDAVRIIIRRPHAYTFKMMHPFATIPGVTMLDANGKFVGSVGLPSKGAVDELVGLLRPER